MDKEYEIVEKSFLVPCKRDPAGMERRCYVRLLIKDRKTVDAQCNGCDDLQGGEPCITCRGQVRAVALKGEA